MWNKQIFAYVNHAQIRSWNQPVLSNESKVSCSMKQRGPLMGIELTTDRYPPITSQTCYPLRHAASRIGFSGLYIPQEHYFICTLWPWSTDEYVIIRTFFCNEYLWKCDLWDGLICFFNNNKCLFDSLIRWNDPLIKQPSGQSDLYCKLV